MRKLAALAVTLALVMALLPAGLVAAAGPSIAMDRTTFITNEPFTVSYEGVTQQMVDDRAWAGIYVAGSDHWEYGDYGYVGPGSGELTFDAPYLPGAYEMRFYSHNDYSDTTFIMQIPFTVTMDSQGRISLAETAYRAGEQLAVAASDITAEMELAGAFVAIYRQGAPHSQWMEWDWVPAGDSTVQLKTPNLNGDFEVRLYAINHNYSDESFVMSVPFTLSGAVEQPVSDWAVPEIARAAELGLIPDSLITADLTQPITRAEFAAVSVLLYEHLSEQITSPADPNPFRDTQDAEVLKAYNVGITAGVSPDTFAPLTLLNREQAATMLTRVFKKAYVTGWSLAADDQFTFNYTAPPQFADDASISEWAKPSVYFMAAHGVIAGVGDNRFAPRATTSAEEAANYASATREQALAIAVRMTDKLTPVSAAQIVPLQP